MAQGMDSKILNPRLLQAVANENFTSFTLSPTFAWGVGVI